MPATDEQLVAIVRSTGDTRAFDELIARHRGALLAFLQGVAGQRDDAVEDAVQLAVLKAYERLASFRARASFRTWLFSIGHREYLQQLRQRRRHTRLAQAVETQHPDDETDAPATQSTAAHRTSASDLIDLEAGLRQLTREERTAVLLCDAYGLTNQEAATTMDAPLGSVKTYVRRGRARLRELLHEDET